MKPHLFALFSLLTLLGGCTSLTNMSPQSGPVSISKSEAVVVLGVKPRYRTNLGKGFVKNGIWSLDQLSMGAASNTFPEDGFIVVKIPARSGNERYGVAGILPEGIGPFVAAYAPCSGQDILTFEAPGGAVVYVGDIDFTKDGDIIKYTYSSKFESAKVYLLSSYPALAESLIEKPAEVAKVSGVSCTPMTIQIPIYVPRGK